MCVHVCVCVCVCMCVFVCAGTARLLQLDRHLRRAALCYGHARLALVLAGRRTLELAWG